MRFLRAVLAAVVVVSLLWASGVVPAIVPANVPVANKRGNSALFQLASGTSPQTNDCAQYDASGNLVTAGIPCGTGATTLTMYLQDTTIVPISAQNDNQMNTLLAAPGGGVEVTDTVNISGTTTAFIEGYLYTPTLGVTSLPTGTWEFDTYASLSSTTGTSEIRSNAMRVRSEAPDTVGITGAGTSRTATCTAACAGTPFAVAKIDTGGTIDSDSYLQTPTGWFRITARTSDTVVTVTTPATYVNETAVAFSVWKRLFQVTTGTIPQTAVALYSVLSAQPAFTVLATDRLGAQYFAASTGGAARNITLFHNGSTHYSHFHTTLGGAGAITSVFSQTGVVDIPVTTTDIATPANPAAGMTKWYTKGGTFCALSPAGVETCTGSGGGGTTLTAPIQADWTAFNTTGMVVAPTFGSARWEFTTQASAGKNIQGVAVALPTVPYSKIFRVWPLVGNKSYSRVGIGFADGTVGTPGKLSLCELGINDPAGGAGGGTGFPMTVNAENWTNTTTSSTSITLATGLVNDMLIPGGMPVWVRIGDNNTNWTCDVSWDFNGSTGNWMNVFTEARNTFLTATQLVVSGNAFSSSQSTKVIFDSYQ